MALFSDEWIACILGLVVGCGLPRGEDTTKQTIVNRNCYNMYVLVPFEIWEVLWEPFSAWSLVGGNLPSSRSMIRMMLLLAEILHQLRLVVYPIIYRVLYIPFGCLGFQPSTCHQQYGYFDEVVFPQFLKAILPKWLAWEFGCFIETRRRHYIHPNSANTFLRWVILEVSQ